MDYDLAKPNEIMDYDLSENCPEDLFIRIVSDFEEAMITSTIIFLPEEEIFYNKSKKHFIGIDWSIYDAPSCYDVDEKSLHNVNIPIDIRMDCKAFISVPFYIIPEKITYFEYWLDNSFCFPINMENLCIQFMDIQEFFINEIYRLKNTTIKEKNDNLFVGAFARVTDGWKFYPRMTFHQKIEIKGI